MFPAEMRKETSTMLTQSNETYREVLQVADNLYRQDPDWVTFFREVLGIDGIVRRKFPSFEDLTKFEQTEEFDRIQKMLVKLREKRNASDPETEPTRVITVRLPKSMHEYLRTEAHDLRTSMNKLCISKLLQVIGEEMIPNERTSTEATSAPAPRPAATQPTGSANNFSQPTGTNSFGGGYQPQTQPQTATMPFKPSQPRF
jgi:predicted HicB family RNase H-like nuclease